MQLQIKVPDANILSAFVGASRAVNYWAEEFFFKSGQAWGYVVVLEALKDGDKTARTFPINRKAICKGLELMAMKQPHHFADLIDEHKGDQETTDIMIQMICFGEVLFG